MSSFEVDSRVFKRVKKVQGSGQVAKLDCESVVHETNNASANARKDSAS